MALTKISVRDFRCFSEISTDLPNGNILIVGPNASGKTSFLEAIYFLGRGRSFRVAQTQRLIKQDATKFVVAGETQPASDRGVRLGVQFQPKETLIRINGEKASGFAALAENLPVQVIHPDVHHLVEGGPGYRRRFLDWGVFHVEHDFLKQWRDFNRALKQRNAGLRQGLAKTTLSSWDQLLVSAGQQVHMARQAYVESLEPHLDFVSQQLLGCPMTIQYRCGWGNERSYEQALAETWQRDCERKSTGTGPQRAELQLYVDGKPAQGRISRGQQKLAAAGLILSQLRHLEAQTPRKTLLLLDDPAAELDNRSLERFLALAGDLDTQLFITALRETDLPKSWLPQQLFHVKQGMLQDVVQ